MGEKTVIANGDGPVAVERLELLAADVSRLMAAAEPKDVLQEIIWRAEERERAVAGRRAPPGQGEKIALFLLCPDGPEDTVHPPGPRGTTGSSKEAEDFAVCQWPVAIKVKQGVSKTSLLKALKDFVDQVEGWTAETAGEAVRQSSTVTSP